MSKELDEIARRCQAAGLDFTDGRHDDLAAYVIVHFPSTDGIPIYERGQDRWVLEEVEQPFEEFEALLQGLNFATWSSSQQMIESNLVELDPEVQAKVALGRIEHQASYEEEMKQLRRVMEGKERLEHPSKDDKRQERIKTILSRLAKAQNRSEYSEAPTNPKQRISIVSNTDLEISVGLSSNIHALVQEEGWAPERSLTLQIRGTKVRTQEEAAELLVKVANSVFFAIDEAIELSLALEGNLSWPPLTPSMTAKLCPFIGVRRPHLPCH